MSSTPNQQPQQQQAPPGEEKKRSGAPVITPQILTVVFVILVVIAVAVWYGVVIDPYNKEAASLDSQIQQTESQIATYQKKKGKREKAERLSRELRSKLNSLDYLFLANQDSVLPFWEDTFLPLLFGSRLQPTPDSTITADSYLFQINMAMSPFKTLPGSSLFDDSVDTFPIDYIPEQNGQPIETPVDTSPANFLEPYSFGIENWSGTYRDVKDFVEEVQEGRKDKLITVHCMVNDDGSNVYGYRTQTLWTVLFTVYFMNPEASASGENPPAPPGDRSC